MPKRLMIQCATAVAKDAVSRETIDGVEHIIVSSSTLPDNIVMNGILYPAEEIKAGFHSLERTLAPVEHPVDVDGNFISASDPIAIHNFHAGAFNTNVQRINGRVKIDKTINVQEALKSDRGKRLLDRINALETKDDAEPIHTSVGVFIELEELKKPLTEFNGMATNAEFTAIARNLVFDHDAILLDTPAAANPSQGVGMAVNAKGDKMEVQRVEYNALGDDELSHDEIRTALNKALNTMFEDEEMVWTHSVFDKSFVFHRDDKLFQADYVIVGADAHITTTPVEVDRIEVFPVKNHRKDDAMKEVIVNALKKAGIEIEGLDEDALLLKYNELQANADHADDDEEEKARKKAAAEAAANADADPLVSALNKALVPMVARLDSMESKLNQSDTDEVDKLAKIVGDSALYPSLDIETAKAIAPEKLRELAANCKPSHGIAAFQVNSGGESGDTSYTGNYDMPD